MTFFDWLVAHHVASIVIGLTTAGFSVAILGQRRPTGSAFAWILVILFVPYLGIPLYVVFGGRKFRRRAREKSRLPVAASGAAVGTTTASVTWLGDGVDAYATFLREIQGATKSIRLVTFVLGDDTTGCPLTEALIERAKAGVEVRLLLDDFLRFHAPHGLLRKLEAAGGVVQRFMPLFHIPFRGHGNLRNHRKIALFDGARAIVGGMNLADEYMGPKPSDTRWRDLSTVVTGAAVETLDAIFRADWEFASGKRLDPCAVAGTPGSIPLRVIPSGPDSPNDPIYDAILTALFRAESRFWVSTPYFIPDEPLMRALSIAARRGIDVRIFLPGRSNHLLADLVAGPSLRELEQEGVRIHRHRTMLHAKTLLVDDTLAVVGSANFDMRSLFLDYEIALFFSTKDEVTWLEAWFEATRARSDVGAPKAGFARARVESVVRLLAPLL
jgi:cardiolipin synthase